MTGKAPVGALTRMEMIHLKGSGETCYLIAPDDAGILTSNSFQFNCYTITGHYYFRNYWLAWAYREKLRKLNANK